LRENITSPMVRMDKPREDTQEKRGGNGKLRVTPATKKDKLDKGKAPDQGIINLDGHTETPDAPSESVATGHVPNQPDAVQKEGKDEGGTGHKGEGDGLWGQREKKDWLFPTG